GGFGAIGSEFFDALVGEVFGGGRNQPAAQISEPFWEKRNRRRRNHTGILDRGRRTIEPFLQTLEDPRTRHPRILSYQNLAAELLADCAAYRDDCPRI